ncbi:MAG: O-succinylhomoserine sulfhydrylase [Acidiferrobacteraceae bacterium]
MSGHPEDDWKTYGPATRAVRAGDRHTPEGEHSEPIFMTSSYVFDSAEQAFARFTGKEHGNTYSRSGNPTVRIFEERLASLEGAQRCIATASGMSAILALCLGTLRAGDRVVASKSLFGPTVTLFQNILTRFGIGFSFVPLTDLAAWRAAAPGAKLLFLETPTNPLIEVGDLAALAEIAHAHHALLAVDNSFCSPVLQTPLSLGADIVVHSATKYIDGQGRCLGGAVLGSEALIGGDLYHFVRTAGPVMSPFNAWVFLKGLETLSLRMQAHSASALALAEWLERQQGVRRVYHPYLASHPQHALAKRQQSGGGGMLAFELDGGRDQAWRFVNALRLISRTANLGDAKTTITHPATTTHARISDEARREAGITEGLLRVSVGLEDLKDLKHDLARGFAAR